MSPANLDVMELVADWQLLLEIFLSAHSFRNIQMVYYFSNVVKRISSLVIKVKLHVKNINLLLKCITVSKGLSYTFLSIEDLIRSLTYSFYGCFGFPVSESLKIQLQKFIFWWGLSKF